MPARIDADQRRSHVIEAAFRLIFTEGLEGLSLRKVASEADLNIGSVRHFFNGHDDLLTAAAQEAGDRMGQRLANHPAYRLRGLKGEEAVNALQDLLEQVLPVDDQRRVETIIVLELIRASRTQPVFAPVAAQMASDLHDIIAEALTCLDVAEPGTTARQVTAMIGGLSLDTVTPHGALTVEQLRIALRAYLSLILTQREAEGPP